MSKIRFHIVPPVFKPEEKIFICGNLPELGGWDTTKALPLKYNAPFHDAEIEVAEGAYVEYKIIRGNWESEMVDAYGDVPPNFQYEAWFDHTIRHVVADWKDRFMGRVTAERVFSRILAGGRDVLIWLPPGYATEETMRFPVIYLHDGENIFDPLTSAISGVDWAADEWAVKLWDEDVLPESIIVAVRHPEGFSEENETLRDFDLSPQLGGASYSTFIATELVRYIDTHYRTLATPEGRMLGGSDLGALNSFYTAFHYPGVFSRVACLSTAFEDVTQSPPQHALQLQALEAEPALPAGVKMYFDYGDHGRDECYDPYHAELGGILREKGWKDEKEFVIRKIAGGTHDELSWRARFGPALRFLAGK